MTPIRSLDQLVQDLRDRPSRRLAVAAGHDPNTIAAAGRAAAEGIAAVTLVGDAARIAALSAEHGLDPGVFTVVDEPDTVEAGRRAVAMVRAGEADVLMKGLIATSDYMKQILNRETGLLPEGRVLSHVSVFE
ncbi:MAG: phosphate acyltransferase, partial [Candidatus Krumholzibacteriia bacterium]